jgi:uncharacterized protein YdhG (YjbR/CyaY superfamily)
MKDDKAGPGSIDDYIKQFPTEVQVILQSLRHTIRDAAPEATEKMSYQMPTFYLNGNLVHFAAYEKHIGFYPAPSGIEAFKDELSKFKGAKGSVQFPIDVPLPLELIKKIVRFRVEENSKLPEKKVAKVYQNYSTPEEYIKEQPPERQTALARLWEIMKTNLSVGFEVDISYGMIGFAVPHSIYPKGYHVDPNVPLPFLGLANQKHYIAVYHLGLYADKSLMDWFVTSYETLNIGKLDMGKSCIRFKNIDRIPYELIGELCTKMSVESYVSLYEANRSGKME